MRKRDEATRTERTNGSGSATDVEEVQCCRDELYAGHRDVMMRWACWNTGEQWGRGEKANCGLVVQGRRPELAPSQADLGLTARRRSTDEETRGRLDEAGRRVVEASEWCVRVRVARRESWIYVIWRNKM